MIPKAPAEKIDAVANEPETWKLIRSHPVFHGASDEDVRNALPFLTVVSCSAGETLIEEGAELSMDLYLILQGKLEVIKKTDKNGSTEQNNIKQLIIAQLNGGDVIGELSFSRGLARSASIRSLTKSILLSLSPQNLRKLEMQGPRISTLMMKNMVGYVSERLKRTSENEVRVLVVELQNSFLKAKANIFFSYVIGLLCVYNLTLHITTNYANDANSVSFISAIMAVVFSVVLYFMTLQSKLPLKNYGLTTKNWGPALRQSLMWSVLIIVVLVFIKWTLINNVNAYRNLPLFDFDLSKKHLAFNFILYGLHCPVQEFIARGVLQGSLQRFFSGRNVTIRAIIVSNALFSATHVHVMGGLLGIIVFIPGLFWGWLYSKHDNLIGVSVSHLLVGWTALFFLNLESLF